MSADLRSAMTLAIEHLRVTRDEFVRLGIPPGAVAHIELAIAAAEASRDQQVTADAS